MEDNAILDLYFARDEGAISVTKEKYGRMINSVAYHILNNFSDSEECEADTYLVAWNKIPPQRPGYLAAFLGKIARNLALTRYEYYTAARRSRSVEVTLDELEELLPDNTGPGERLEAAETAACISAFLRKKSRTKRMVFIRRYWYCDSIEEIAGHFGFSTGKVKSMLLRLRTELKRELEKEGVRL